MHVFMWMCLCGFITLWNQCFCSCKASSWCCFKPIASSPVTSAWESPICHPSLILFFKTIILLETDRMLPFRNGLFSPGRTFFREVGRKNLAATRGLCCGILGYRVRHQDIGWSSAVDDPPRSLNSICSIRQQLHWQFSQDVGVWIWSKRMCIEFHGSLDLSKMKNCTEKAQILSQMLLLCYSLESHL